MFKENKAKSTHAEPTKWFDRAPQLTSYASKQHNYKRGKSPMISTDNMHQGYIFRVCSVVLLVVQCYRFCCCCSLCLLALLHIPSWGWGGRRGSACMLYFVAAVALCVRVRKFTLPVWQGYGQTPGILSLFRIASECVWLSHVEFT